MLEIKTYVLKSTKFKKERIVAKLNRYEVVIERNFKIRLKYNVQIAVQTLLWELNLPYTFEQLYPNYGIYYKF